MKITLSHIFNEDGTATITDNRDFFDCKIFAVQKTKEKAMEKILVLAPDYKQRNAALGLLSEQETQQIKDNIQTIRNISNSLEQQILAITWDGTEETRISACDAVQDIRWP